MAQYSSTEMWTLFTEKASAEKLSQDFIKAVGEVCHYGETLAKTVIAFFPTFTLHDEIHLSNVSDWMLRLLGDCKDDLSAGELACLLMATWCHDIGMTVSETEKAELLKGRRGDWKQYFDTHFDAKQAFETEQYISEETLRDFVRLHHADRAREKLNKMVWPKALTLEGGITRDYLIALCESHGREINHIQQGDIAFRNIAALLRMADLLDYDASRAPADLFSFIGLDAPSNAEQSISRDEWVKNRGGGFQNTEDGVIRYNLISDSLQLEKDIERYIHYAQSELEACNDKLCVPHGAWQRFALPHKIEMNVIQREGYEYGDFHITMDQDRVLELLTGNHLYEDAGVFVRELLQNAIDAVLTRRAVEHHSDGAIRIDTWNEDGDDWFRIEDDGIGMTEKIITDYFLKVGRSYYNSDEFRREMYGNKPYTPISHFGIGILSCFMSDPENTLLEVSTLRYGNPAHTNAIRLNVDGLYGYYYMITDRKRSSDVKPLHRPKNAEADEQFRSEPGTTICVRTKLRHLGDYASFRQILDKYILYPEVVIEHRAWRPDRPVDKKTYLTRQEVTRMIHAKNPDGPSQPPKEHAYPFPDDLFEEIKAKTPDFIWEKRPELVFQFYPLDWLDDNTGNLHGVAVTADIRLSAHSVPVQLDGEDVVADLLGGLALNGSHSVSLEPFPRITLKGFFSEEISERISSLRVPAVNWRNNEKESFFQEYPTLKDDPHWNEKTERELDISREHFESVYMEMKEKKEKAVELKRQYGAFLDCCERIEREIQVSISGFLQQCVSTDPVLRLPLPFQYKWYGSERSGFRPTFSSCNGIVISSPWPLDDRVRTPFGSRVCFILALFSGAYRSELEVSREKAASVSTEMCYMARLLLKMFPDVEGYSGFYKSKQALTSEQDYLEMMQRHPSWDKILSCKQYLGDRKNGKDISLIQLAALIESGNAPVAVDGDFEVSSLLDLAVLKDRFKVCREFNKRGLIYVSAGKTDCGTLDFPPQMFFAPAQPTPRQCLGCIKKDEYNYFDPAHPFSKWLIANREAMLKDRRSAKIFSRLLEGMLMENTAAGVAKAIQYALEDLQNLPGTSFHIDPGLYITEADLLQFKLPTS